MHIRIDSGYMFESLMCFINETLPEAGMVYPDIPEIFILIAARGDDITYSSSSNSEEKALETLRRAVALADGSIAKQLLVDKRLENLEIVDSDDEEV